MLHVSPVLAGPLVRVADVTCCAPRGGCGSEEHSAAPEIVVPRRGVFTVHRGRQTATADPMTAVVLHGEYRVSHPADGGDRCTAFSFAPELHEEALGDARILRATQRLAITLASEQLEAEEQALHLLADLAAAPQLRAAPRVQEVRELLAARPTQSWTLTDISRAVHTSPYHLARQFRAATGHHDPHPAWRWHLGRRLDQPGAALRHAPERPAGGRAHRHHRGEGDRHLRWTFNDIRPDSFVWRGEQSNDGGASFRLAEEMRLSRA